MEPRFVRCQPRKLLDCVRFAAGLALAIFGPPTLAGFESRVATSRETVTHGAEQTAVATQTASTQTPKLGAIPLPPGVTAVKVENGYGLVHDGELSFLVFDLAPPFKPPRLVEIHAADLGLVSISVQDFSLSPDRVLYISAFVNFGMGDRQYALLRYPLLERDGKLQVRHLPDVRCRHLGAGRRGVWCLDPDFREARNQLPTLNWIAFLGTFKTVPIARQPGMSLGPARVMVGSEDRAEAWLPSMRAFLEVDPQTQAVAYTPIPVAPTSRAITSFAPATSGRVHALLPLRGSGEETLTTPYALAELDPKRETWRRVPIEQTFPRGAVLAGWDGADLWLWNRPARRLERIEGVRP